MNEEIKVNEETSVDVIPNSDEVIDEFYDESDVDSGMNLLAVGAGFVMAAVIFKGPDIVKGAAKKIRTGISTVKEFVNSRKTSEENLEAVEAEVIETPKPKNRKKNNPNKEENVEK